MIIYTSGQLKEQIIAIGKKLVDTGLVLATWGNISCRIPKTPSFFITPSGIPYYDLKTADLVQLDFTGKCLEGTRKPSTESLLHGAVYQKRPDVQAIVHTHSNYAAAFAVVRAEIPPILEEMAQLIGGPVKVARYALPGTGELAEHAVEALEDRNAVLLANHGVVAVGRTLDEAFTTALLVEKSAHVLLAARQLGTPYILGTIDTEKLRQSFLNDYGQKQEEKL